MVLSIREYEKLYIRELRDLNTKQISREDAISLQNLIINDMPVFKWGNRCLIAQQWVGVIDLPEYSIEILPKLANDSNVDECRLVLTRMLLIAHQAPSIKNLHGSVKASKNSLTEVLIAAFLTALEYYLKNGMLSAYRKVEDDLDVVKGRIVFGKQFNKNALTPIRFQCSFTKYIRDNPVNQFFATCLGEMNRISRDSDNLRRIRIIEASFDDITRLEVQKAINLKPVFNSINISAEQPYKLGYLFLSNYFMTLNAGNIEMNIMLFDMNHLFELFMFKVIQLILGSKVRYQNSGHYLVKDEKTLRKYIKLRPDIIVHGNEGRDYILDTKWKLPSVFAKESDIYQMNAYSSGIGTATKVFLIYPETSNSQSFTGDYEFISSEGTKRKLGIRAVNLGHCLSWSIFMSEVRLLFCDIY